MHTPLSGNSAPPLQRVTAPVGMKSPLHHHYHSTGGGGIPGRHTLPLFSPLTPEREEALRAKGRQLLDEHHREVAEKGLPYAADEMAVLQARGRELLRTAREAAAANGGHHVPAPMLSAAARMAAATAHLSTLHTGAPSVGVDGDRSGTASSTLASTQLAHPTAVVPYPDIAKPTATAEAEVPAGPDKLTSVDVTAMPSPSLPSKTQELLAAVQRLPRVVEEQQAQLHEQTSSAPVASEEFLSKSQVDTLRQTLIQQFNEHMAQCERANQAYWAQVSSQHEKQLSALRLECAAHERRAATAEAAAQTQQLQRNSETEANANTANARMLDISLLEEELQLARQQHINAEAAKKAVEAEAAALRDTLRVQSARLSELEHRFSYVDSKLPAVQEEADQAVQAIQGQLDDTRRRIAELEAANAELLDANAELRAARESDCGAANPFADAEADGELDAARRRIAELEAANAELLDANAELRAARESDCGAANPFADAEDDGELDAARRRIAELEAANAELLDANAELRAARESDCGAANPFADAEDDGELDAARRRIAELEAANAELLDANAELRAAREGDCGAANPFADAEDDGELDAARRRIAELEAANAELLDANAELRAARESDCGAANPFADAEADGELDAARRRIAELEAANAELLDANAELRAARESDCGAANPFADAEDDGELDAARRRIAELEAANAELLDANAELRAARESDCGAANPFADAEADGELDAARRRIAELEAANAELLDANAELRAARESDCGAANPFADAEADGELDAARRRIAELEAANAELLDANAELRAAREGDCGAANPFADAEDDGELDAARRRIAELEAANAELLDANAELRAAREGDCGAANPFADAEDDGELDAARRRIAELEAANAELLDANAELRAAREGDCGAANPFADAEDDGELDAARRRIAELEAANAELLDANAELRAARESDCGAANPFADAEDDGELDAARRRIAELEAANAELLDANAELRAARESDCGAANPFADAEADGELDAARRRIAELEAANAELLDANAELRAARESDCGAANPFADAEDDGELDAARRRIAELEAANAELLDANAELRAARESDCGAANPFADAEDDGELDAARRRIAELEAANAELLDANAELRAARESDCGAANPFADAEDDGELDAARRRIAELEAANAELLDANAELRAAREGDCGAANPFADAEDDGELDAARRRIAELEAANAELLDANAELRAARESDCGAAKAADGELEALRQYVADLEDSLAEAAGDLERLQEDVEEKSRLIQALRAGEAALSFLPADFTGNASSSRWNAAQASEGVHSGLEEHMSGNSADLVRALRARVADLTHELQKTCRQQEHLSVSAMVPGMEALGRQYADVERRLALAEEANAALEDEVQQLRGQAPGMSCGWMPEEQGRFAEAGGQISCFPDSTARTATMATASASLVKCLYSSSDGVEASGDRNASNTFVALESAAGIALGRVQPAAVVEGMPTAAEAEFGDEGDDDSHNTPHTLASYHMGCDRQVFQGERADAVTVSRKGDAAGRVFGADAEEKECRGAASSCMLLPAGDEDPEVPEAVSAGRDDDVDFNDSRLGSRDIDVDGDEDDDNTAEWDVSVSTRAAASHGLQTAYTAAIEGKVDDSGAAMQKLGRQYADAQHRLYRSEEARQSLEAEVVELREMVEELRAALARQPRQLSLAARVNGDVGGDAETCTITTSFASSVPTAVRERPTKHDSRDQGASSPTAPSSGSADDDVESGSLSSAHLSEQGVSVTTTAAPAHDDDPRTFQYPLATAASEDTAALRERIADLEARLREIEAQHEEELQAIAEAAADRITAMEQQYADDMEATRKAAVTAEEECRGQQEITASLMARVTQLTEALADAQTTHAAELQTLREEHEALLRQRLSGQEDSLEVAIEKLEERHQDHLRVLTSFGEPGDDGAASKGGTPGSSLSPQEAAQYWKAQHTALLKRFGQLQREYGAFSRDIGALQRRANQRDAMRQEQDRSRTMREATAQQLTTLHRRLEAMSKVVDAAQADAQARSEELRDFTARHSETEAALCAEVSSLRSQVQSARDELARANNLNGELSELLQQGATSVETALQDRDAQCAALGQQVQQLKLQLAAAGDRLADQQAALHEQRVSSDALQQRLVELEEEKRAAEAQLRGVRRDIEERERAAISAADRGSRDAEQARAAAQEAMARQNAAHAQEIAALHRELDDLRSELEVAQTVAATVPLEAQHHQRDLGTVRDRLAEALRSQQELQQQLNRSRVEVERQRLLMRGGCGTGANASDTGEYEGGVRGGAPASDARLNTLLHRSEELEEKLRETTVERDGLQQERDRLSMQVKSAARVAEVKEQATRRQEAELRSARSQIAAFRVDLAQRVQSNHALQLEMDHLQERLADTTRVYEELKGRYSVIASQSGMQEHAVALLMAKAVTIPRALEEYEEAMFSAYHAILQAASKDRRHLYDRCDRIEKAASEAMAEAEAQSHAYEVAIADAQEEQQQMKEIIERLHRALQRAEEEKDAAVAAATEARAELEATQRQAREDVFNAQRDLQGAELQHADTLHSLSLLQDEMANTAALIKNQKKRYEQREAELMEEVALLQAELETRKSSARQLQLTKDESCAELQDAVDEAVQARDRAVHEAQALQAQLARVLPRLAQLEDEQAQRTADLMDTAQQLSALHKKTTSTENVSRKHIEELNQTLQELLQAHVALQRTHTFTEATADRLKSQLTDVTEELQRTAAKASQQEEELAAVRARLHEVETHTSSVIADDQARLQDSERRLNELEQRNTALQQECKKLQECLQSLRIEHDRTVDALQQKSEAMAAQGQQVNAQLQLLRERVATLEAERQELMSSEQAVTASRDLCQREILSLEHQVEHLQRHLDTSNGHNERLNQEVVQLKSEHAAEVDRLREAMTDAQKELNRCRQLLAKAEARQMEQESTNYSLSTEVSAVQEELKAARAQAEKAMQQCRKAKAEQEEMVTLLQSQMAQLHEELRGKQEQLRVLENTSAHQQDILNALRQDIVEAEESLKRTRRELLNQQEAAAAAKEHHRRDRYELQAKLNDAEDAMAEMTRSQEQYRQRMTTKLELYEVAEEALRGEVTDLRADVARLEEALATKTHDKAAAETHQSRQAQFIKAAESELQSLRAQTAHDMEEITNLKLQVQQRTAELDRCRRETAAQLGSERLRWESEHTAARDALEEALRQEQQASKEAREARERALTLLDCKQKAVCSMEDECRAMREQLRQLRRSLDAAQHQLTSLEGMAKDTADDLGMTLEDLLGGEGSALVDAAPHPHDTFAYSTVNGAPAAVSATAVQSVMDELQRRLHIFTFAAHAFDSEDDQVTELRKALERHEDVVQLLAEACTGGSMSVASSATPLRTGRVAASEAPPGLNSTPAPRSPRTAASSGADRGGTSASTAPPHAVLTAVQRGLMQHIGQASSTYVHRVEDHLRTAQQMLRCVMMAIGSHEIALPPASHPSTAALSSRHRLHVAATVAELHRRTAALTRAAERTLGFLVQCGGGVAAAERSWTHSHMGNIVQEQLQELRRLFSEAERYVLVPFNELLCAPDSTGAWPAVATTAGEDRGAGGQPLHKSCFHTERSQLVKLPGPDTAFATTAASPERPSPSTTRTSGAASVQEVTVAALSPIKRDDGAHQWF
ncbi:hypothetical protein CUR178_06229 [Leishmania enriettii]|uniref:Uncharacterized protein n=1 Tax=Leishmania enriettii TaxID=5663 RepID=A0A836HLH1_LEIEN|nr:hypothetical protein CUR178_06229 [Leishmania enriettii]